ncbi:hypothetical protein GCM10023166_22540 [Paeniglutamicibacter cryotolerans]
MAGGFECTTRTGIPQTRQFYPARSTDDLAGSMARAREEAWRDMTPLSGFTAREGDVANSAGWPSAASHVPDNPHGSA